MYTLLIPFWNKEKIIELLKPNLSEIQDCCDMVQIGFQHDAYAVLSIANEFSHSQFSKLYILKRKLQRKYKLLIPFWNKEKYARIIKLLNTNPLPYRSNWFSTWWLCPLVVLEVSLKSSRTNTKKYKNYHQLGRS